MKFQYITAIAFSLGLSIGIPVQAQNQVKNLVKSDRLLISQVFRSTYSLPAGTTLITKLADSSTLLIGTGETKPTRLRVIQNIIGNNGVVLIPVGAVIEGDFVPVSGGSRFVARNLNSRGGTVRLGAESELINDVKDPRKTSLGGIAGDAAIGGGLAAILGAVTGDRAIATEELLAGAAAAVLIGNVTAPQVTVIEPNLTINLLTSRNLAFRTGGD